MKKFTLITIAGVALIALAACNKAEKVEEVSAPQQTLKLDLNIINSLDTKAVKTDWESGDKIYVFFGKPEDHTTPAYLTLTYSGSKWSAAWTGSLESEIAGTSSGTLSAVYTPGSFSEIQYNDSNKWYVFIDSTCGYYLNCDNVPYTVSAGVLTATLNMAVPTSHYVQFFLAGESANVNNLQFACDGILKTKLGLVNQNGEIVQSNYATGDAFNGIVYKGGIIFSGILSDYNGISHSYTLTITDTKGTADTSDDVTYTTTKTRTINYGDALVLPALDNAAWTVTP